MIAGRAPVGIADPAFLQRWDFDHPQYGRALVQQRDQRPERGFSGDKALGAIDRVDHPRPRRFCVLGPEFFADKTVCGVNVGDPLTQGLLDFAIDCSDGRIITFEFHVYSLSEITKGQIAGRVCKVLGKGDEIIADHRGGSIFGRIVGHGLRG